MVATVVAATRFAYLSTMHMKSHKMLIEYGYLNTSMRTFGNIEKKKMRRRPGGRERNSMYNFV